MTPKQAVLNREPQASVFYDELFYDAEWCSHCFARVRDVDAVDRDNWGSRLATAPTEHRTLTDNAAMGYDTRSADEYDELEADHPKAYCGECGRTSAPDADHYSTEALRDAGNGICDALEWLGYAADRDAFFDALRAGIGEDRWAGYQTELLAWATGRALRLAAPVPDAEAQARA